jgi:hypothetical protein
VSKPLKVWKGSGIARSSSQLNLVLCLSLSQSCPQIVSSSTFSLKISLVF